MTVPIVAADAVTPAWLTQLLRDAGVISRAAVTRIERTRIGTGLVGQNVRFTLTYDHDEPGAPASVVGKFPSTEPLSRRTAVGGGIYEREVRFYREVAPTVHIRTPACYAAAVDSASGDFVVLLEDLAPARQGDQIAGCSIAQAELALAELAGLHAPRWGEAALQGLDWLPRPTPVALMRRQQLYQAVWPRFLETYEAALPPGGVALGERFGRTLARALDPDGAPPCITHGDYRIDNMLFGTAEGGYPLAVVDWQTVGIGAGAQDAAYFLGAGPLVAERRTHEERLLRCYYDALLAGGVHGYSWDACWRDYRRGSLSGLSMTVVASMIVETDARGVAMFSAMAERHFSHALEIGAEEFFA
ncbi:MAG TPA: phosphotransferase [Dehalococcoidia bacterium]|nr:phosphotransferase [Dehalococcoidia bacterium]